MKVGDEVEIGGKKWRINKLVLDYTDPAGGIRAVYTDKEGETFGDLEKWLLEEYNGFHGELDVLGRRVELMEWDEEAGA